MGDQDEIHGKYKAKILFYRETHGQWLNYTHPPPPPPLIICADAKWTYRISVQ